GYVVVGLSAFLAVRRPATSTLFPYTTLFRSDIQRADRLGLDRARPRRHDADLVPPVARLLRRRHRRLHHGDGRRLRRPSPWCRRSEEHTSELQSRSDLVCRLLLEKKKRKYRR